MGDIRMKKICAFAVAFLLALSCAAFAETGTFTYVISDGEACVTGYTGSEASLSIPAAIDACPVTMIAGGAFLNMTGITDVTIPVTVAYIGDGAFMGCSSLNAVTILNAKCELGKMVFRGCDRALTITGLENSTAQSYAASGGYAFVAAEMTQADTYAQALEALEAGDLETAQMLFAGLDRYEDSRDYDIYTTARLYEKDGQIDTAVALYLFVPDILDAADRLVALEGSVSESQNVKIGGSLPKLIPAGSTIAPEQTAPIFTPTPEPTSAALISFHEFIGGMPYEFDDYSKERGMYTLYYYIDDFAQLDAYRALFTDAGWTENDEGVDSDGWHYVFVMAPDGETSFYIAFVESDDMVVFMYDSSVDYGFDPLKGL